MVRSALGRGADPGCGRYHGLLAVVHVVISA